MKKSLLICFAVLLGATVAIAAPFSDIEVIRRLGAIPRSLQVLTCTTTNAVSAQLPANSMLRLSPDSSSVYYMLGSSSAEATTTNGVFLPQAAVEYVQNGSRQFLACVTRSGTAYLSISVME